MLRWALPAVVIIVAVAQITRPRPVARPHHSVSSQPRRPGREARELPQPPSEREKRGSDDRAFASSSYTVHFTHTFFHVHTHELMPVARVDDAAAREHFLRCRLTGVEHEMAREPFGVALALADEFGAERVEVVSGFRSPKLNESLRKKGHEVASDSQHTHGTALDFRLPGVPAEALAHAAGEIHQGGIGTYRESDFIHVDTGRVRRWNGH